MITPGNEFTLVIRLGNDEMQTREHISKALERVKSDVLRPSRLGIIWDDNGNSVGTWRFENRE